MDCYISFSSKQHNYCTAQCHAYVNYTTNYVSVNIGTELYTVLKFQLSYQI